VIAYAGNDQFIIAAQAPDNDCVWTAEDDRYAKSTNVTGNGINFWIIDITSNTLNGPLSLSQYLSQRQQMNIPEDFHLSIEI
jgi:hypothetical protein